MWEFVYPDSYHETMDEMFDAVEMMEDGLTMKPDRVFREILREQPYHLDAAHHLAVSRLRQGDGSEALYLWEQAVDIGRRAFPLSFSIGRDMIPWLYLDNRPFLRCLYSLATLRLDMERYGEGIWLLRELLLLNPGDNQGCRYLLAEALLNLGRDADFLVFQQQHKDEEMPEFLYGRVLASYRLGKKKEAELALRAAVNAYPLVGRELVKKRHTRPKDGMKGTSLLVEKIRPMPFGNSSERPGKRQMHWTGCGSM